MRDEPLVLFSGVFTAGPFIGAGRCTRGEDRRLRGDPNGLDLDDTGDERFEETEEIRVLGVVTTVVITASESIDGTIAGDSRVCDTGSKGVGVMRFGCNSC